MHEKRAVYCIRKYKGKVKKDLRSMVYDKKWIRSMAERIFSPITSREIK